MPAAGSGYPQHEGTAGMPCRPLTPTPPTTSFLHHTHAGRAATDTHAVCHSSVLLRWGGRVRYWGSAQSSQGCHYCALRAISISRILSSASFTLRSRYDFFCCKAETRGKSGFPQPCQHKPGCQGPKPPRQSHGCCLRHPPHCRCPMCGQQLCIPRGTGAGQFTQTEFCSPLKPSQGCRSCCNSGTAKSGRSHEPQQGRKSNQIL